MILCDPSAHDVLRTADMHQRLETTVQCNVRHADVLRGNSPAGQILFQSATAMLLT